MHNGDTVDYSGISCVLKIAISEQRVQIILASCVHILDCSTWRK